MYVGIYTFPWWQCRAVQGLCSAQRRPLAGSADCPLFDVEYWPRIVRSAVDCDGWLVASPKLPRNSPGACTGH